MPLQVDPSDPQAPPFRTMSNAVGARAAVRELIPVRRQDDPLDFQFIQAGGLKC